MKYSIIRWERACKRAMGSEFGIQVEFFPIGCTPVDEACTPCGERLEDQIKEVTAYIHQIIRVHGEPVEGCEFFICENHHEFGIYYEAAIFYEQREDPADVTALDYALKVDCPGIDLWDEIALEELRKARHYLYSPRPMAPVVAKVVDISKTA